MWLRLFSHLLPRSQAWRLSPGTRIRQFFQGLANALGPSVKLFYDLIWTDLNPATSRELGLWEDQFGLRENNLNEADRRIRLAAAWTAIGGQDPSYLQATLRDAGFDVYVHEWWVPGTEPGPGVKTCVTPRNPLLYLRQSTDLPASGVDCGEALAECGEVFAECGNTIEPPGYALVTGARKTEPDLLALCGEALAECGEATAECGEFDKFREVAISYTIPTDSTKWPYFLYIGGLTFGDLASVPVTRKTEFENLCRKLSPSQQWLGLIVEYV